MKQILTIIILLMLSTPAHAGEWFTWDETNTELQVPLTVLLVADLGQTLWAHDNYWQQGGAHEDNYFLGKYPNRGEIQTYFAGALILTPALAFTLPSPLSYYFQSGIISIEIVAINKNYTLNIGMKF